MTDAAERDRFENHFTAYCPEGHLCTMGGKHLKYSRTLRDARHKLANHLFSAAGHSQQYKDWEVCVTTAAKASYFKYTYDSEHDKWSERVDVQPDEDEADQQLEEEPRPPVQRRASPVPDERRTKRPRTPELRRPPRAGSSDDQQPPPRPPQTAQPQPLHVGMAVAGPSHMVMGRAGPPQVEMGTRFGQFAQTPQLLNQKMLIPQGAFGPRAGYLPTGIPDLDFQRRVRLLHDAANSVAAAAMRSAQVAEAACMGWRAEAESMRMVAAELRHLAEKHR